MEVSWNRATHKSSIWMVFSIRNHPLGGTTIYGNLHISSSKADLITFQPKLGEGCGTGWGLGFHRGSPIAGWFISWKFLFKWMIWGTSISGNLHMYPCNCMKLYVVTLHISKVTLKQYDFTWLVSFLVFEALLLAYVTLGVLKFEYTYVYRYHYQLYIYIYILCVWNL